MSETGPFRGVLWPFCSTPLPPQLSVAPWVRLTLTGCRRKFQHEVSFKDKWGFHAKFVMPGKSSLLKRWGGRLVAWGSSWLCLTSLFYHGWTADLKQKTVISRSDISSWRIRKGWLISPNIYFIQSYLKWLKKRKPIRDWLGESWGDHPTGSCQFSPQVIPTGGGQGREANSSDPGDTDSCPNSGDFSQVTFPG